MAETTRERPDTVHGRLMESVHLSGYSFERACSELEWLLDEDRWRQVAGGFEDFNDFLRTIDLSEFRHVVEQRKELAERLKALGASVRTTGKMLGVSKSQIHRDVPNGTPQSPLREEGLADTVPNGTPAWFSSDVDPAKLAKAKVEKQNRLAAERDENYQIEDGCTVDDLDELIASGYGASVIYADPPWSFQVYSGKGKERSADRHYDTMSLDDICNLPIGKLAGDDCALFLWAVMPELPGALRVIEAWGFKYKTTAFVWTKQNRSGEGLFTGMGYWTRANAEVCLLATRGSPKRIAKDVHQVIQAPVSEHSEKPAETRARIHRLLGAPEAATHLELFGRQTVPGWTVWGNQIPREELLEAVA
jgi:N6-adenosine-specific RNA methylase IME4